jgi:hypothetical protein
VADLALRPLRTLENGRGQFEVVEAFAYRGVTVEAGFITDLCSVPGWALWVVPVAGYMVRPAIKHDFTMARTTLPYAACHAKLYADMRAEGVALWRCALVWAAVTIKHPRRP